MSKGINKVILIGNLGADPEIRYMPNGGAIANISIATNESWKDKQTGELQEYTEWHRVSFFDKLAQIVAEYLKKGSKVYIEGSLRTKKWKDPNGNDRYSTEIRATTMQMLDSKDSNQKNNVNNISIENTMTIKPTENIVEMESDDIPF